LTTHFQPGGRAIRIPVVLEGPAGRAVRMFSLDTGASHTAVLPAVLADLGYETFSLPRAGIILTASGSSDAGIARLVSIEALDLRLPDFPILAIDLPQGVRVSGLLGLDFLRGRTLTIDFAAGEIELT